MNNIRICIFCGIGLMKNKLGCPECASVRNGYDLYRFRDRAQIISTNSIYPETRQKFKNVYLNIKKEIKRRRDFKKVMKDREPLVVVPIQKKVTITEQDFITEKYFHIL